MSSKASDDARAFDDVKEISQCACALHVVQRFSLAARNLLAVSFPSDRVDEAGGPSRRRRILLDSRAIPIHRPRAPGASPPLAVDLARTHAFRSLADGRSPIIVPVDSSLGALFSRD